VVFRKAQEATSRHGDYRVLPLVANEQLSPTNKGGVEMSDTEGSKMAGDAGKFAKDLYVNHKDRFDSAPPIVKGLIVGGLVFVAALVGLKALKGGGAFAKWTVK